MIEIAHIDHISMAVADLDAQVALLEGLFGFRARGSWTDEEGGYQGASLEVPGRSGIDWEVMAPLAGDNQIQRFLDGPRGPGLHHITFEVANVDVAMGQLLALGIEPWGVRPAAAGEPAQELYVHPRLGHGFLFQLTAPAPASWHLDAEAASATTAGTAPTSPPAEQATGGPPAAVEASESNPSLGVIAINHLSHAHTDPDLLAGWCERVFGMEGFYAARDPQSSFQTRVLETPTRQMRWEILAPAGDGSFVERFLADRGPSMHHVALEVGDWEAALAACEHYAVPTFGHGDGVTDGARWLEAFIHPRYTGGMLVQVFWQERPGVWI